MFVHLVQTRIITVEFHYEETKAAKKAAIKGHWTTSANTVNEIFNLIACLMCAMTVTK